MDQADTNNPTGSIYALNADGAQRAASKASARWAIDTLKERVPIWKKEFATDGAYWVEDTP